MLIAGVQNASSGTTNEMTDTITATQQTVVIAGTVVDEAGEPVIGANISIGKNPEIIAVSDTNGFFSLKKNSRRRNHKGRIFRLRTRNGASHQGQADLSHRHEDRCIAT